MLSDLLRWGGKRPRQPDARSDAPAPRGEEPSVPTKAFPKLLSAVASQTDNPVLIDFGPVIGSNVAFYGERLGCKLFIEDLFADYEGVRDAFPPRGRHRRRHPLLGLL